MTRFQIPYHCRLLVWHFNLHWCSPGPARKYSCRRSFCGGFCSSSGYCLSTYQKLSASNLQKEGRVLQKKLQKESLANSGFPQAPLWRHEGTLCFDCTTAHTSH
eukprot:2334512-Amphidinium_carterae.1